MSRAGVFLDRDGVLNEDDGFVLSPDELRLVPGAAAAVRRLNDAGLPVIVVTNQSAVARGLLDLETLDSIHRRLDELLLQAGGGRIDAYYFCPHYPEALPAGVPSLQVPCECRKPGLENFRAACRRFDLDPRRSFVVGDKTADIEAGRRLGARTILVRTGHGGRDGVYDAAPDRTAADLAEAARMILEEFHSNRSKESES